MINQIVLVGKIKEVNEKDNKKEILLEVERPFKENQIREKDIFTCNLWSSIFNKIVSLCNMGDLIGIKGRIINENEKIIVVAENVVLLNKSKDTF